MLAGADPPDAFFTLKNSITIYTFEAFQKLNISIPGRVALVGYDDFELAATLGLQSPSSSSRSKKSVELPPRCCSKNLPSITKLIGQKNMSARNRSS